MEMNAFRYVNSATQWQTK